MSEPVANFAWPAEHPIFAGHFPGQPIVPAVMLLERVLHEAAARAGCEVARLAVREAKFLEPLQPGQTAALLLDSTNERMPFRILRDTTVLVTGVLERRRD